MPPGRRTWHALAAPLAEPWSREESDLIDLKDMLASRSSLDSTPDSEEPPPCNVSIPRGPHKSWFAETYLYFNNAVGQVCSGIKRLAGSTGYIPERDCVWVQVVAVFAGKGKVAGLNYFEPRWVDGRLWQYDNGGIGFLWIDPVFQHLLVDLKRIDDDFR